MDTKEQKAKLDAAAKKWEAANLALKKAEKEVEDTGMEWQAIQVQSEEPTYTEYLAARTKHIEAAAKAYGAIKTEQEASAEYDAAHEAYQDACFEETTNDALDKIYANPGLYVPADEANAAGHSLEDNLPISA